MRDRLLKLKKWLTIEESACHLSTVLEDEVSESDIFRLALDGHLKLSANLINTQLATLGEVVGWEETKWFKLEKNTLLSNESISDLENIQDFSQIPANAEEIIKRIPVSERKDFAVFLNSYSYCINDDKKLFINFCEGTKSLNGVFDLPMIGAEKNYVEYKYQILTNGPALPLTNIEGVFLQESEKIIYKLCSIADKKSYTSASIDDLNADVELPRFHGTFDKDGRAVSGNIKNILSLMQESSEDGNNNIDYLMSNFPNDVHLVIKTDELRRFEQEISEETPLEKPLKTTERNTLLTIIAALCKYDGINPADRSATSDIVQMTEDLGAPVSDDTVRNVLKKIPNALESRRK